METREYVKRTSKQTSVGGLVVDNYNTEITAPFTIKCVSTYGELYKITKQQFEIIVKKDQTTKKAFLQNYKQKQNLLQRKMTNMHMEMKFKTNLPLPMDENEPEDDPKTISPRIQSPVLSNRDTKLIAGEIRVENITTREKKTLTKQLMRNDLEFRDKMREIVKDFPTMRDEVGGGNFEKTIGEQLFDQMKSAQASFASFDSKADGGEEIISEFQSFLKNKHGPPDSNPHGKEVVPKAIATQENLLISVKGMF